MKVLQIGPRQPGKNIYGGLRVLRDLLSHRNLIEILCCQPEDKALEKLNPCDCTSGIISWKAISGPGRT